MTGITEIVPERKSPTSCLMICLKDFNPRTINLYVVHWSAKSALMSSEEETPQIEYEADTDDLFKVAALCHSSPSQQGIATARSNKDIDAFPSSNQDLGT
ncbi:hypothetical protein MANES_10G029532v8 [Manihot esculenta]|uniref:Uncharacterized protein n=1 Tax=Manihot esculenta TaxID=3983 RepID=A0ACB7GYU8_MANES|nr:hypothetical protein MANES_10G029532v8 [Manihot esculenta]